MKPPQVPAWAATLATWVRACLSLLGLCADVDDAAAGVVIGIDGGKHE